MAVMAQRSEPKTEENREDGYPVDLVTRALSVEGSTINEEKRTVEAILVTDNPVTVFDRSIGEFVDEILTIDGMELPESRQVPFLDNHSRWETTDVIGSVRNIRKENGVIKGTVHFSSLADDQWTLVKERHLTDVSASYQIFAESSVYIERGQEATVKGKIYKNSGERTLAIRTKWKIKEVSATPIGADEGAKMRSVNPRKEPAEGHNIDQNNSNNRNSTEGGNMPNKVKPVEQAEEIRTEQTPPAQPAQSAQRSQADVEADVQRKAHEMVEKSTKAKENIQKRAKLMGLSEEECREACEGLTFYKDGEEQRALDNLFAIQERKIEQNHVNPGHVEHARVTVDGFDNFRKITALSLYQTGGGKLSDDESAEVRKSSYGGLTLQSVMRAYLDFHGVRGSGYLSPVELYKKCVDLRRSFAITGGDLSNIFLDVASKDLAKGYQEIPTVHQMLCGVDRATNFLPKYTVNISNVGDMEELKTGEGFPMTSMSDSKESVQLKIFALALIVDMKAVVNDTLNALVGVPAKLGQAARRLEETLFWNFLYGTAMAGPTMGEDNKTMFHADHRNFVARGSGGAPTTTTLQAAKQAMRRQRLLQPDGRASVQYLNVPPRYIVAHGDLMQNVEQRISAVYDIDSNATANNLVPNLPFIRGLQAVDSPYLDALMDANDHKGWYLFADPGQMAAINKVLLLGQEAPTLRQKNSDVGEPLGTIYDIYHIVNFGQVDYRPVYANFGK
jgi:hypothetical protein